MSALGCKIGQIVVLNWAVAMKILKHLFETYLASTDGAVAIEYALIAVALSLAIIGGFPGLSAAVSAKIQAITASFASLT
jgi:Flp pilus assembly pilin Flp